MAEAKKTTKKTTTRATAAKKAPAAKAAPAKKEAVVEEFKVVGSQLVDKFKELIKEGNVRRIVIKQGDRTILVIPMTLAVVGVALVPVLAALGALAALLTECTLEVERDS